MYRILNKGYAPLFHKDDFRNTMYWENLWDNHILVLITKFLKLLQTI